jgi:chromosome segregation ATPase
MSVEFSNAYQEVLLENLDSILKQNFMFQTKLKLFEKEANIKTELQAKLDDLTAKYQQALDDVGAAEQYKVQASSNDAIVQEKSRIQSALNEEMKKSSSYKEEIDKKNADIIKLSNEMKVIKEELETLKELVPVSKLKKLDKPKPVEVVKKEEPKIQKFIKPVDIKPLKVESGGTF